MNKCHKEISCNIEKFSTIASQVQTGLTGKPFVIASYALFTMMSSQVCDLEVDDIVHTLGDVNLHNKHFDQVNTQLARTPGPLPTIHIDPEMSDLFGFAFVDFTLEGYDADPGIVASIAL